MKNSILIASLGVAGLLSACGGGGSSGNANPSATISSVTANTLMYGRASTFTVAGQNLDQGIVVTAPKCNNITATTGGTSTQQMFSCIPVATGPLQVALAATGGAPQITINPVVLQPQVTMKTTLGDVVLELAPANAPLSVNNFLQYTADGFYNNKIFHRVINDFVVQGGGFDANLQSGAVRSAIKLESVNGLSNLRGTIAMARTDVADSATSQFFINVVDNTGLDGATAGTDGYAVFGKVVAGMGVVDQIKVVPTQTVGTFQDIPVTPVIITSATQTQ